MTNWKGTFAMNICQGLSYASRGSAKLYPLLFIAEYMIMEFTILLLDGWP